MVGKKTNKYIWGANTMGRIRLDSIPITDKIHMDDLRSFTDFVKIDVMVNPVTGTEFRTVQEKNDQGFIDRHLMYVDITFFEQKIFDYVEVNHSQDEIDTIVNGWKVPSYNLLKERDPSGLMNGSKLCNYVVNVDEYGYVKSIVIMTERNCRYVLDWVLEMVS